MHTVLRETSTATTAQRSPHDQDTGYRRHVAVGVLAVAIIMLVGSLIDLGVLWGLQRQVNPQWEYVAVSNTLDAMPRFLIALGFMYVAIHLLELHVISAVRALAVFVLALGLFAAGCAALMVFSYLAIRSVAADPGSAAMLRSLAIKAISLSTLYCAVLIPLGIWQMRRPAVRSRR